MKRIAILLTLLSGIAFGQVATRFDGVAQTTRSINGNTLLVPSPNASVTVCTYPATGGLPCTNKASVCPDSTGVGCTTGAPNNPITADAQGNFGFWGLPGTYQYTVCPTGGVCRGPYNASLPFTGTGTVIGDVTGQSGSTLRDAVGDKTFRNAVTDYSAPINGTDDALTQIQACLTASAKGTCKLPANATAISGGTTGVYCDYFISDRLVWPSANSTYLEGVGPSSWSGAVRICVMPGHGGFRIPKDCYSCGTKNIEFVNTDSWDYTDSYGWTDWPNLASLTGDGLDGGQILGGSPVLENTLVSGFGRHCYYTDGAGTIQGSSQPDLWFNRNIQAYNCRGFGHYTAGGDSNAGLGILIRGRYNNLGNIYNGSVLGNTYLSVFSDGNTRDALVAGSNINVTSTAVASNVKTITFTSTLAGTPKTVISVSASAGVGTITTSGAHGYSTGNMVLLAGQSDSSFSGFVHITGTPTGSTATFPINHANGSTTGGTGTVYSLGPGKWITDTGSLDGTFNGTCKLLTVPTTTTATCNFTHADGSTTGGTAATSTSAAIYAKYTANGITFGPITTISNSSKQLFINPYSESAVQQNYKPGSSTFILGGNQPFNTSIDWSAGAVGLDWSNGGFTFYSKNTKFYNKTDNTGTFDVQCGDAADQVCQIRLMDKAGSVKLSIQKNADNSISILNNGSASDARILITTAGQMDIAPKSGTALRIVGGTSAVQFTGSDFTADATIDVNGLGTFNGGMKAGASGSTVSDSRELVQNAHSCGTTTTCANTANGSNRIIFGTVALSSGTPSTAVVSSITAFTSTSSYVCTLTNMTNAANNLLKVVNTSTSSFTITGPNTITDTIAYQCIGN